MACSLVDVAAIVVARGCSQIQSTDESPSPCLPSIPRAPHHRGSLIRRGHRNCEHSHGAVSKFRSRFAVPALATPRSHSLLLPSQCQDQIVSHAISPTTREICVNAQQREQWTEAGKPSAIRIAHRQTATSNPAPASPVCSLRPQHQYQSPTPMPPALNGSVANIHFRIRLDRDTRRR